MRDSVVRRGWAASVFGIVADTRQEALGRRCSLQKGPLTRSDAQKPSERPMISFMISVVPP